MRSYSGIAVFLLGAYVLYSAIKGIAEKKSNDHYVIKNKIKDITGGILLIAAGIYLMLGY